MRAVVIAYMISMGTAMSNAFDNSMLTLVTF